MSHRNTRPPPRGGRYGAAPVGRRVYADNYPYHEEANLVDLVKSTQRRDKEWSERWKVYCDELGGGTQDPRRHSVQFLTSALIDLGLPPSDNPIDRLVQRVKQYQRNHSTEDSQWIRYCEEHGRRGVSDPAKYDEEFLRNALETMDERVPHHRREASHSNAGGQAVRGGRGGSGGGASSSNLPSNGAEDLVEEIKQLQKSDQVAHEAYLEYCDLRGMGVYDPARHTAGLLRAALKFIKRAVNIVAEIKLLSKQGFRGDWINYCDRYGEGVYDPVLHNTEFLEEALKHLKNKAAQAAKRQAASGPMDLTLDTRNVVSSFRMLQKKYPQLAQPWRDYCDAHGGGVYDPSRLQEQFVINAVEHFKKNQADY